jgi:DNA-directed RNA polymerase specialized sigma24 family protein
MKRDESESTEQEELPLVIAGETISAQKEAEWVQQAIQGNQDALVKLCDNYAGTIFRYFFRRVRSTRVASISTLKTLRVARESINSGEWDGIFFGKWLFLIAEMVFNQWLREKMPNTSSSTSTTFKEPTGKYTNAPDDLLFKDEESALWRLAKDLSLAQQRLLTLRHIDHLSFAEIAICLGCSEEICRQLYQQALIDLKCKVSLSKLPSETRKE